MAIKLFYNIGELLTLKGASVKQARSTQPADLSILKEAYILTEGERIISVGLEKDLERSFYQIDEEINLNHQTVVPAFIDPHTHLIFAGDRRDEFELRNQGVSYLEIAQQGGGIASTVQATRAASLEDLVQLGQKRVNNFLKQGVTTVEIKSGYGLDLENETKILQAANQLKNIRKKITFLGPHSVPKEFATVESYFKEVIENILPQVCAKGLCDRADIFVEESFFTLAQLEEYKNKLDELGIDLVVHADQLSRTGSGVWAAQHGALSADHLIEVSSEDIQQIAATELTSVLLPAADYYLNMSYPPARSLIDQGGRVALGTDFNPGSSPTQNISFVGQLARLKMQMSLAEVIVAMTLGAAYALKLQEDLGSIEVGKVADFVSLKGSWTELFYDLSAVPVDKVWSRAQLIEVD